MKNLTIIIGNLGKDAEVRHTQNATAITFNVATSENWKDQNGQKRTRTTWFNCTKWVKPDATSLAQYLTKGTKVYVEGKISVRAWNHPTSGEANGSLELRVAELVLLGGGTRSEGATTQNDDPDFGSSMGDDDDLPF